MSDENLTAEQQILAWYKDLVLSKHPKLINSWPVLCGRDQKIFGISGYTVIVFISTRNSGSMMTSHGLGDIDPETFGLDEVNERNLNLFKERAIKHFRLTLDDAIIIITPEGILLSEELDEMLQRHEQAMGLSAMKVFLSHKGTDKPLVREFEKTLRALGFDPWLDEVSMSAGAELERALLRGFNESCAVVFFITPNYVDENFLATEVDYAISEKRKKGEKFSIVTIVLEDPDNKAVVPELLRKFVWKKPANHLEALRDVLQALPIKVGDIRWKVL